MEPFVFPSIYYFPPFFTRQQHSETWNRQSSQWEELILKYFSSHNKWILDMSATAMNEKSRVSLKSDCFFNAEISRELHKPTALEILDKMVLNGSAKAIHGSNDLYLILHRSPASIAHSLYKWMDDTGRLGSISTVYELFYDEDSKSQDFHGLPIELIQIVLEQLLKENKVKLVSTSGAASNITLESGVKFV